MALLARIATRCGTSASRQLAPALIVRTKTTTGIVGLDVVPDAKPVLLDLYAKTLSALEAVPPSAEYRKTVEYFTKSRIAVVESTDDITVIEAGIGGGQVEQLIVQAQEELSLIPKLVAADAFSPYDGSPAEEILTDLKRCARGWRHFSRASLTPRSALSHASLVVFSPARARRRGVALQRDDIPMRPSQDYPVDTAIELELPAPPEPEAKA